MEGSETTTEYPVTEEHMTAALNAALATGDRNRIMDALGGHDPRQPDEKGSPGNGPRKGKPLQVHARGRKPPVRYRAQAHPRPGVLSAGRTYS